MRATGGSVPLRTVWDGSHRNACWWSQSLFTVNSKPPEKQAHHPAPLFIWRKGPQFPAPSPALSISSSACGGSWWRPEVRLVLSSEISSQHSFPSCRPHVFPFLSLKNSSPYSSFPSHGPASKGWALDIQGSSDFRDPEKNKRKVCLDQRILFSVFRCGGARCDLIKPSSTAPAGCLRYQRRA